MGFVLIYANHLSSMLHLSEFVSFCSPLIHNCMETILYDVQVYINMY